MSNRSNRSLSWIDPARWAQLLERARVGRESFPDRGDRGTPEEVTREEETGADPGRLDALLEQVRATEGVEGAFVCDAVGSTLAAGRMETLELSMAPAFMGLLAHQRNTCGGPERGMLMLAFGGRRRLHLLETVTSRGRFALGLVADRTLPDTVLLRFQLELRRAVQGEGPDEP